MASLPRRNLLLAALVFLSVCTPQAGAATSDWLQTDAAGDVTIATADNAPAPPSPAVGIRDFVDLVSLRVDDPHETLYTFALKNTLPFGEGVQPATSFVRFQQRILFHPPGATSYAVLIVDAMHVSEDPNVPPQIRSVLLCAFATPDGFCFPEQGIELDHDVGEELLIHVPKNFLIRDGPLPGSIAKAAWPVTIAEGDELTGIYADSIATQYVIGVGLPGMSSSLFYFHDRLPDEAAAPTYVTKHGMGIADLLLRPEHLAVTLNAQSVIPITIDNQAPVKRLLRFTAEPLADASEAWTVDVTPTMSLFGGKAGNATLRVLANFQDPKSCVSQTVRLTAFVTNEGDAKSVTDLPLLACPPVTPPSERLYIHGLSKEPAFVVDFADRRGFMSRIEEDAQANDEDPLGGGHSLYDIPAEVVISFEFRSARPGRVFDAFPEHAWVADAPVTFHLEFDSPHASNGLLDAYLTTNTGELVAHASEELPLPQGPSKLDLDAPWAGASREIGGPVGSFNLLIEYRPAPPEGLVIFGNLVDKITLLPRVSYVDIPIERVANFVADGDLPALSLNLQDDAVAFVNPGRTTVFEVDVVNEESDELRIQLGLEGPLARIAPGERFVLGPEEHVRVGIVVDAPADAREGTQFNLTLLAKQLGTETVLAKTMVRAIVTNGVDVPNETFVANEADLAKIDDDVQRTPLPAGTLVLAFCVAALFRRRSRVGKRE